MTIPSFLSCCINPVRTACLVIALGLASGCADETQNAVQTTDVGSLVVADCTWLAAIRCSKLKDCCGTQTAIQSECERDQLSVCLETLMFTEILSGSIRYNSPAMRDCFGALDDKLRCTDTRSLSTSDERAACERVLTGWLPKCAACHGSEECASGGLAAVCHGVQWGAITGVCTEKAEATDKCGLDSNECVVRGCAAGYRCALDLPDVAHPWEGQGHCVALGTVGQVCEVFADGRDTCARPQHCLGDGGSATCKSPKGNGAQCTVEGECEPGLTCAHSTCQRTPVALPTFCMHGTGGAEAGTPHCNVQVESACNACLESSCCSEVESCLADSTCSVCLQQQTGHCGSGNAAVVALETCGLDHCTTACNITSPGP